MDVTVMIPRVLQAACEGKSRIQLGVPPTSSVADVLQTLMALYPGLRAFVASEKRPTRQHFALAQQGRMIFLFASSTTG